MASSKASSSSSVPTGGSTFDVFLSFRGEDTRNNFVDNLYGNLDQKGIRVFKDDVMLRTGKTISLELLKSIEESKFAVIVFSKQYANSSWCLDELAKIMECMDQMGLKVIPVFYHVDPSDVRNQNGDFATAFQKHEETFNGEMDKVNKWRKALTAAANLSGYHISTSSGGEYASIFKIVRHISGDIQPRRMDNNLVGIESRINALNELLDIEAMEEVRIVGIYGMGGIGKTTIARTLFRRVSYMFEGSSFVNDVRQEDICKSQKMILKNILGGSHEVQHRDYGADMIKDRCCNKKVLLVLDDVDNDEQLEFLAAEREWFGPGSRIIITTRDEHLLSYANDKYKPELLRMDEAVQLFSTHVFGTNCVPDVYKDLSDRAIRYTDRLPLALKVLGSFLRGRQAGVWENALDRLAKTPDRKIFETLELSFDGLEESEKKIFLDIACFYKGSDVGDVTRVLESLGYHAEIGITVLIDKSLITVRATSIGMHDLIQEMGWEIVRVSFPNSRLWLPDILHDLNKKRRVKYGCRCWWREKRLWLPEILEVIEGIKYHDAYGLGLELSADVFEGMKKLRLLDVSGYFTSCRPTILPDGLQYLLWNDYPFSSLPLAQMHNLVRLVMRSGKMVNVWKGKQIMPNLKIVNLQHCDSLRRFPDVSGAPNIERLVLHFCTRLEEVHKSLGDLKKLYFMEISDCEKFVHLPSRINLESLKFLIIDNCESLKRLPEFSPSMAKLSHISLSYSDSIEELPSSIIYLSNLSFLSLKGCVSLKNLPESICKMKCLKSLLLENCRNLQSVPDEIGTMTNLEELKLRGLASPTEYINYHSLINLCRLRKLDLSWRDIREEDFPTNFHGFSSLEELNLSDNDVLIQLPASISHLSRLKELLLNGCCNLRKLHGLPSEIQVLEANNCKLLDEIEDISKKLNGCLYRLNLFNCVLLAYQENEDLSEEFEIEERHLAKMLEQSFVKKCAAVDCCLSIAIAGSKIPSWFEEQQDGSEIALWLPPKWQTRILGFAICYVLEQPSAPEMSFRFELDGISIPISEVDSLDCSNASAGAEVDLLDCSNASAAAEVDLLDCNNASAGAEGAKNIWISYMPFNLFEQIHDDDDHHDDNELSHFIEGNVYICLSSALRDPTAVRCGGYVVYKEDVESTQQIQPDVSPYYWKWNIARSYQNNIYLVT